MSLENSSSSYVLVCSYENLKKKGFDSKKVEKKMGLGFTRKGLCGCVSLCTVTAINAIFILCKNRVCRYSDDVSL